MSKKEKFNMIKIWDFYFLNSKQWRLREQMWFSNLENKAKQKRLSYQDIVIQFNKGKKLTESNAYYNFIAHAQKNMGNEIKPFMKLLT